MQFVEAVEHAIECAEAGQSRLTPAILALDGMSSPKVRHFLNVLVGAPGCRYLEIGTWKGSTFCSALYGNDPDRAIAIDNFSIFGDVRAEFEAAVTEHVGAVDMLDDNLQVPGRRAFFSMDCFSHEAGMLLDSGTLGKFNVYFYDGRHTVEAQFRAFAFYDRVMDNEFVVIVDDWNQHTAQAGTAVAFRTLGYEVVKHWVLPANGNGDMEQWWNGLYVAVVRKRITQQMRCPRCGCQVMFHDTLAVCRECNMGFVYR